MKKWLLSTLLIVSVTACDGPDGERYLYWPGYFVQGYFELEGIKTHLHPNNSIWLYEIHSYQLQWPVWYSPRSDRKKFLELSAKHGDKHFKGAVLDDMSRKNEYFANDFAEITITSDADFDPMHPAGTPLNEYVRLITLTPIKHVRSGYKETFNWNRYPEFALFSKHYPSTLRQSDSYSFSSVTLGRGNIFPVCKLVSELEPDDMALWGRGAIGGGQTPGLTDPFAVFEFIQKPESPGVHNISIVLKTDTEKTYRLNPVKITFK